MSRFTPNPLRKTMASIILVLCSLTVVGQAGEIAVFTRADGVTLTEKEIDDNVERLMEAGNVHGLGLALISSGEVVYLNAYGMADVATSKPLETDTIMYGASLTKPTFAWMVMTLVDEGLVDLDQPISTYLPKPLSEHEDYADLADDDRWQVWTLRMLLSHQAGLPNWRWFSESKRLEILFEPGSRYAYSGEGIQIAQFTIEKGLGLDVGKLMQQRVFDRFDMHRTSMVWRDDFRLNFSRSHDAEGNNLGHKMRLEAQAAGSMDTTVADFAQFLAAVQSGDGLSDEARAEMLGEQVAITARHQFPTQFPVDTDANRAISLSYGLGWGLFESNFGPAFFKEGHDDGTNNYALCLDTAQRCILLLANSSNGEGIFLYLVDALLGETGLPWEWEGYVPYDQK